jgi:hypothetical protein
MTRKNNFPMKKLVIISLFSFLSTIIYAQKISVFEQYSLGYAFQKQTSVPTFMYSQILVFGKKQQFALGTGMRMSYFLEKNKSFVATTKEYSTTSITPVKRTNMVAFNIPFIAEYHGKRFIAGFNIDLIGLTFGKKQDSLIVKNNIWKKGTSFSAQPSVFNSFLGTKGTTNNEIYVGLKLQEELTIKVGASFLFAHYKVGSITDGQSLNLGSFYYKTSAMPFVSVVFNLEQ